MTATAPALLVGRRLRFRDLEVFFAVVRLGSMAKAAQHLGLTQPAVSDIVSALEEMFEKAAELMRRFREMSRDK